MANTSGTAADINALATAVSTFLTANGWTSNRFDTQGTGRRLELQRTYVQGASTLTQTLGLRFSNAENVTPFSPGSITGVFLVCGTSWGVGQDWHSQVGSPLMADGTTRGGVGAQCAAASISYWIFTANSNADVVIVVQNISTVQNFVSWGSAISKYGVWTGGAYFTGSRSGNTVGSAASSRNDSITFPSAVPFAGEGSTNARPASFVRIDEGGFGEEYRGTSPIGGSTAVHTTRSLQGWSLWGSQLGSQTGSEGFDGCPNAGHLLSRSASALTNNSLLFPPSLSTYNVAQTRWRPIGYHPIARVCYIRGNVNPGTDITVGAATYTVFENFAVLKV